MVMAWSVTWWYISVMELYSGKVQDERLRWRQGKRHAPVYVCWLVAEWVTFLSRHLCLTSEKIYEVCKLFWFRHSNIYKLKESLRCLCYQNISMEQKLEGWRHMKEGFERVLTSVLRSPISHPWNKNLDANLALKTVKGQTGQTRQNILIKKKKTLKKFLGKARCYAQTEQYFTRILWMSVFFKVFVIRCPPIEKRLAAWYSGVCSPMQPCL